MRKMNLRVIIPETTITRPLPGSIIPERMRSKRRVEEVSVAGMVYERHRCHYNVAEYLKRFPKDPCVVAYSNVAKLENGKSTWLFRDDDLDVSAEVLVLWYNKTGIPGHVHLRRGDLVGDIDWATKTMVFKTKRRWINEDGLLFQTCKNSMACAYVQELVKRLL